MSDGKPYVRVDENGVFRVGTSRVMLDSVVAAFQQGHSPETIRQQYPALSLEDVYGSITYYLAHVEEVNAYLRRQDAVWKEWEARSDERPNLSARSETSNSVPTACMVQPPDVLNTPGPPPGPPPPA